jgi:hypothetical protein
MYMGMIELQEQILKDSARLVMSEGQVWLRSQIVESDRVTTGCSRNVAWLAAVNKWFRDNQYDRELCGAFTQWVERNKLAHL